MCSQEKGVSCELAAAASVSQMQQQYTDLQQQHEQLRQEHSESSELVESQRGSHEKRLHVRSPPCNRATHRSFAVPERLFAHDVIQTMQKLGQEKMEVMHQQVQRLQQQLSRAEANALQRITEVTKWILSLSSENRGGNSRE